MKRILSAAALALLIVLILGNLIVRENLKKPPEVITATAICQKQTAEATARVEEQELCYLGVFTVTHYCVCEKCCGKWADGMTASGTKATPGRTIAVDKQIIPLGSMVVIDGKQYVAEDVGGAIKGERIDLLVADHEEALEKGICQAQVWLVKK